MSMRLEDKLSSIPKHQIVPELSKMLDHHSHVSISWHGKRKVTFREYTGEVEINTLANKFLQSAPFDRDSNASLEERFECSNLLTKINDLYKKSNIELNKTCFYRFLTPMMEFRPYCGACAGDPMVIITKPWYQLFPGLEMRSCCSTCAMIGAPEQTIFQFTPEKFKALFPKKFPPVVLDAGYPSERWCATKQMVELTIRRMAL